MTQKYNKRNQSKTNHQLMILSLTISLLLGTIGKVNAALTAVTAKTIKGHVPALTFNGGTTIASDLDALLSFKMPDGTVIKPADAVIPINANPTWKFNQFNALVTADGGVNTVAPTYYYDEDGDIPAAIPVTGTLTATWSYKAPDSSVITLTSADLSKTFDACNAPYTLTIAANSVSAVSKYGDPLINNYGSSSASYVINVTDYKFCYAKPQSTEAYLGNQWIDFATHTWNSGNGVINATYGGGHTSDYVKDAGFKADATTKFPTTGFTKAKFQLVMSNSQTDYAFASNNLNVSVDASGYVTLNNKPIGAVTITATPFNAVYPAKTYTFNPTARGWVRPVASSYNSYNGTECGGVSNQVTRIQLTNSPQATKTALGWTRVQNYGTRAINGSIYGEWGYLDSSASNYVGSNWNAAAYWTNGFYRNWPFYEGMIVNMTTGGIWEQGDISSASVVCKN